MRPNIVRTVCVAALMASLAVVALAGGRGGPGCSNVSVAGTWGYSETGTLYHPLAGALPYASVGSYTLDRYGNLSGVRTASTGGTIALARIEGTATVDHDCTGTLELSFYDPTTGNLLNTATKLIVYLDDSTAARAIITDILLPDDITHLKAVLVTDARKALPEWQR